MVIYQEYPPTFIQELTADGRHVMRFQNAEMSSLMMNVPNTAAVDHRMLCYGPRKIHIIISRKWNIILHVMLWSKTDNKRMFGPDFFYKPVN